MKKKNALPNNLALIWQPHFMSCSFRPAMSQQKSDEKNYIIVACSPEYNGVWEWDKETTEVSLIMNGKLPCYVVPISSCRRVQKLESIRDKNIRNEIIKAQKKFCEIFRDKEQSWMLEEVA